MKTVFKVGMEVWDKTISPNKGKVIEVLKDTRYDFPIKVEFNDGLKIKYTNEGCFVKSKGAINTLSTVDYSIELEGFEQKAPVPTFEEAWEESEKIYEPKSEYDKEEYKGYPSQELADAAEALRRLLFLRDYYNEGWQPNKKDKEQRGVSVTLDCDNNFMVWGILKETEPYKFIFKNDETAEKFLEEQRELLEIAKPLL